MLCQTNKATRDYLLSMDGGVHWAAVARRICGEEYWPPVRPNQPHGEDGRYVAMLRLCPWLSNPVILNVHELDELPEESRFCFFNVIGLMKFDGDDELILDSPDTGLVFSIPPRPYEPGEQYRIDVESDDEARGFEVPDHEMTEEEKQYIVKAEAFFKTPYFSDCTAYAAQIVHDGVVAIKACSSGRKHILFFSTKDFKMLRAACEHISANGDEPSVVFRPGEMWFATAEECESSIILYFGPSMEKAMNTSHPKAESAFWELHNGDTRKAVNILQDLGLPLNITCKMFGMTLLHHAASLVNEEAVRVLVESGMPLDDVDYMGDTVAYYAHNHGNTKIISMLTDAGVDMTKNPRW